MGHTACSPDFTCAAGPTSLFEPPAHQHPILLGYLPMPDGSQQPVFTAPYIQRYAQQQHMQPPDLSGLGERFVCHILKSMECRTMSQSPRPGQKVVLRLGRPPLQAKMTFTQHTVQVIARYCAYSVIISKDELNSGESSSVVGTKAGDYTPLHQNIPKCLNSDRT